MGANVCIGHWASVLLHNGSGNGGTGDHRLHNGRGSGHHSLHDRGRSGSNHRLNSLNNRGGDGNGGSGHCVWVRGVSQTVGVGQTCGISGWKRIAIESPSKWVVGAEGIGEGADGSSRDQLGIGLRLTLGQTSLLQ